jgi:hypothetical protein
VITDLLELIDAVQVPIDRLDARLTAEAKNDPRVKVLTTTSPAPARTSPSSPTAVP